MIVQKKMEKKFLCIKTLFRPHISNKKKYVFPNFRGGGGPSDERENSLFPNSMKSKYFGHMLLKFYKEMWVGRRLFNPYVIQQ